MTWPDVLMFTGCIVAALFMAWLIVRPGPKGD